MPDAPTCSDCAIARHARWHTFRADCAGCRARMLARGPQFFASAQAGKQSRAYRAALDASKLTHADVLRARSEDYMHTRKEAA